MNSDHLRMLREFSWHELCDEDHQNGKKVKHQTGAIDQNFKFKEEDMKRMVLITIIGTLFLVCGGALNSFCGEVEEAKRADIYGAFVDNYIQKCEAKVDMLDSGSAQIRQSAIRATVKGAFLQSNRTDMISYLIEKKAPMNADRIAYHLNQRYAKSIYPQEVYVALFEETVNQ